MVAEDSSKKDYSDFYAAVDNKLLDGGHRISILKELDYKSIITRTV